MEFNPNKALAKIVKERSFSVPYFGIWFKKLIEDLMIIRFFPTIKEVLLHWRRELEEDDML